MKREEWIVTAMRFYYLAKIENYYFENELYFYVYRSNYFNFYYILGYSINDLKYNLEYISNFSDDVVKVEKHDISGLKIGISYGFGFSILESSPFTFHINFKNRDIYISRKVENFNIFLEFCLTYNFNIGK